MVIPPLMTALILLGFVSVFSVPSAPMMGTGYVLLCVLTMSPPLDTPAFPLPL